MTAGLASMGSGNHRFDLNVGYRRLAFSDTLNNAQQEQSLTGRGEYHHKLWKGLLRGTMQYEFGSGLEYRKEYTYLEVAPGQGMYTWKDYNNDSVKQLNEFELAVFQDEANYLRVFTPTNTFERVYTMQYNQSIHLDPAARVDRSKPWGRFLARFSDQGNYRVEQKVGGDNPLAALNPFRIGFDDPATILLSYALRNTLFFNRSSSKFDIKYTTSHNAISNSCGVIPGHNYTWTVAYQRTLTNNMQLNIQYNGRKSPDNPMVHVGTVQVRAFF